MVDHDYSSGRADHAILAVTNNSELPRKGGGERKERKKETIEEALVASSSFSLVVYPFHLTCLSERECVCLCVDAVASVLHGCTELTATRSKIVWSCHAMH